MANLMLKSIWKNSLAKLLLPIALSFFSINGALAHSFNVTLIIPLSGTDKAQGDQFLEGFMLATRERDGHPDEESDGHLGGLDVYVTTIDGSENISAQIEMINAGASNPGSGANIVSYLTSEINSASIQNTLDQSNIALLVPGEISNANGELLGDDSFFVTFNEDYNADPTAAAIRGYNAARRIDQAIRAQGSASDVADLMDNFSQSATDFNW
ncbi:hypothetical protein MNBD_ALPHA11-1099 [hydrothermal vent metagenome]|uniref:Leucine-binding protein domain-containing protein n=1 Tax=hydrothermal vent metagenome TaxID=652676 RepID=A0A3B0U324_9ZZZZ